MRATLLVGGVIVELDPLRVTRGDLLLIDGRIGRPGAAVPTTATLDVSGCLLVPGLVLAHTHLYSGLATGFPAAPPPPTTFREILERVWWRLDRALDGESLEISAKVAAVAALRAGVTCLVDHHESPSFIDGSLDVLEGAVRAVGLRAALTYGATDRHGRAGAAAGLAENARFLRKTRADDEVRGMVGLHAAFTVSDETLAEAVDLAQKNHVGIHLHAAEGPDDQAAARARWGTTLIEHLDTIGALSERTVLAHGVHLSPPEVERVRARRTWVTHQPRSNMNNGVGYATALPALGRVALGTDGIDGDVLAELGAAFFRRREALGPSTWPDAAALLGAGHRLASTLFGDNFGSFTPGAPGDVTVLAYDPPTPVDEATLGSHLIFGVRSQHVRDVFVGGRLVLRNRRVLTLDERALFARAREVAPALFARAEHL